MAKRQIPGQGQLFDPAKVSSHQFAPVADVVRGASSYMREAGLGEYRPPNNQLQVNPRKLYAIAGEYKKAQAGPEPAGLRQSYESLRHHTNRQFEFMTRPKEKGGLGMSVQFTDHDPYDSPQALAADVSKGQIKVLKTSSTGSHAFLTDEENDRFRAVHDVFGHVSTGRGFSRHGEEAAYQSHKQMFPKEAHAALVSETRGQNSYLNRFGTFPDQGTRLVGLPKWTED